MAESGVYALDFTQEFYISLWRWAATKKRHRQGSQVMQPGNALNICRNGFKTLSSS